MAKLLTCVAIFSLALLAVSSVVAAQEPVPCYYYGTTSDGHLNRPTAFATWWWGWIPEDLPLSVQDDYLGIALAGYLPGTKVELTIIGLPAWAWPELKQDLIGRSVVAIVADRPGGCACDMWPLTFARLTGSRMWTGLLYVTVQEITPQ